MGLIGGGMLGFIGGGTFGFIGGGGPILGGG